LFDKLKGRKIFRPFKSTLAHVLHMHIVRLSEVEAEAEAEALSKVLLAR
jgi:hypothetical protein